MSGSIIERMLRPSVALPARRGLVAVAVVWCCCGAAAARAQRTLSFAERVACRERIEDVYWAHRLWPRENPGPKPSRESVLPRTAIARRVEESLRYEAALAALWHQPLTSDIVQAEMDRQARQTRDPEMLRDLWAALGDDPILIAECLVRPELAERRAKELFRDDAAIHAETRARAERERAWSGGSLAALRGGTGETSEAVWVEERAGDVPARDRGPRAIRLPESDWTELTQSLARALAPDAARTPPPAAGAAPRDWELAAAPLRTLGPVRESTDRFFVQSLLRRRPQRIRVATVSWPKTAFETWWLGRRASFAPAEPLPANYRSPIQQLAAGCADDTWTSTAWSPEARSLHTAVWTGTEMIIWGGYNAASPSLNSGGRYTPATDSWVPTGKGSSVPTPRFGHTAVWTGTDMIVWGGGTTNTTYVNTGARYFPSADSWGAISTGANVPAERYYHTAVWTGTQMIVWGGFGTGSVYLNSGGRYTPGTDSWLATSTGTNVPSGRYAHATVWTGSEMIIWGGTDSATYVNTGARYAPGTDSWTATSTSGANPSARVYAAAVWTGSAMIVWGGADPSNPLNTGALYAPGTDSWTATSTGANVPPARARPSAVWTSTEMIVWGGSGAGGTYPNAGGRYTPGTNTWSPTSVGANVPAGRTGQSAVWTGSEMIVWGGNDSVGFVATGGRYAPAGDTWLPTSTVANTPRERAGHAAVWTGSEMIVWGGWDGVSTLSSGARYAPATDSWLPTSAPPGGVVDRENPTAVWTGTEMIVWGGDNTSGYPNSGARYSPGTDSWLATSTGANVPAGRTSHTAVWTGSEMIVWGGETLGPLNSGGRYAPSTNTWAATSTGLNVPSARTRHSAVWTGSEMIIWGGNTLGSGYTFTGGRYAPGTDTWTATLAGGFVPTGREHHSAVWTGQEMIVWGGADAGGFTKTGARYAPATNSWQPTSTGANTPVARYEHTAIWTGDEMIVWGGVSAAIFENSGGRYDPRADTWTATSTGANVPGPRSSHTAVWTGREMIVWGGTVAFSAEAHTGGRYCAVALGSFFALTPCRLFDSRLAGDAPPLASQVNRTVQAVGKCSIPAQARALSTNLTAVTPGGGGSLQAFATGTAVPNTTVLSFNAGRTRANNAIVQLGTGGALDLRPTTQNGSACDFIIDVNGYFH